MYNKLPLTVSDMEINVFNWKVKPFDIALFIIGISEFMYSKRNEY